MCGNCERAQETFVDETYIRVGTANVQLVGCRVHTKALIDIYRKGLDKLNEEINMRVQTPKVLP
jgi:hypothetical protein